MMTALGSAIVVLLMGGSSLVAEDQESGKEQARLAKKDQGCEKSDATKTDESCHVNWQLLHAGFPKAIATLLQKPDRPPGTVAGTGITIAQLDTGVVDYRDRAMATLRDLSINLDRLHPNLPKSQVVVKDDGGGRLPLSYFFDSKGRLQGCSVKTFNGKPGPDEVPPSFGPFDISQPKCGPRSAAATVAPRDMFDKSYILPLVQPGHGTRTMSAIFQAAPGVSVVPYKFSAGVILTQGRTTQLADAMVSAALEDRLSTTSRRVDVISMSIGRRSPAPELDRAARLAEQRGIIVVAAAGQLPPIEGSSTRFPAQYASVIATTGSTVKLQPWGEAGRGPRNAVSAPAFAVWRSSWEEEAGKLVPVVGRGSGTSFAAPLVAAAAALWLEFHGRETLESKYGRAAIGSAFRHVLMRTARTPKEVCEEILANEKGWERVCSAAATTWNRELWGQGILAVDRILSLQLPDRSEVCEEVYKTRGPEDFDAICPARDAADIDLRANLFTKAVFVPQRAKVTWMNSVAFGNSFGAGAALVPSASIGVILSGYEAQAPQGLFLQGEIGRAASFKVGLGYAVTLEYSPKGHSERTEIGRFPGFGPAIGVAARAAYMHRRNEVVRDGEDLVPKLRHSGTDHVGLELQLSFYRVKMTTGYFWEMGRKSNRDFTWSLGWGF